MLWFDFSKQVIGTLGNFTDFVINNTPVQPSESSERVNAFHILTIASRSLSRIPKKVTVHNKKDKLKNDITDWLKENGVGWSLQYVEILRIKVCNTNTIELFVMFPIYGDI